jgi:hypothetical protein
MLLPNTVARRGWRLDAERGDPIQLRQLVPVHVGGVVDPPIPGHSS